MIGVRFVYMDRPSALGMERPRFRAPYSQTLRLLDRELRAIDAKQVTILAGFRLVRSDGWPYSSARPEHPACMVQFQQRNQILVFRAAKYAKFEDNLRAIALSLEALRAVDRYGAVQGEQYRGFAQIEAPAAMTREDRIRNLRDHAATDGERSAAQAALDRIQAVHP